MNAPDKYIGIKNRSALPQMTISGVTYFVDFRLEEIRPVNAPYLAIWFIDLDERYKKQLRGIRAERGQNMYIDSIDN